MRALSLFSGIGGFDLAAEWTGFEVAGFVELDPFCQKVLRKHWPHVKLIEDIHNVKGDEFGPIDIIYGGFPCQPFSVAGLQRGEEDDRYLWPQTMAVIAAIRPRWCLLENVTGIIKLALDTVLADLEAEGYTCGVCVLPACAKNAPHRRDRVWIVGNTADLLMEAPRRGRDASKRVSGTPSEDDVADTEREGRIGRSGDGRANSNGVEKNQQTGDKPRGAVARCSEDTRGSTESRLGFQNNGVSRRMARHFPELWETDAWELGVPRVAVGVKDRVDRLKSLGNSIVPQVVYEIMMAIKESMRC